MIVIFHNTLEELLDERNDLSPFRVSAYHEQSTKADSSGIPWTTFTFRVQVASVLDGAIHVYIPLIHKIRYMASPQEKDRAEFQATWQKANEIKEKIVSHLKEQNIRVRPGTIGLPDNVQPILGEAWAEEETVEVEGSPF